MENRVENSPPGFFKKKGQTNRDKKPRYDRKKG